ncbi:MAG TPA: hypothetical protein VIA61_06775 [Methylomirabilota bacterium]
MRIRAATKPRGNQTRLMRIDRRQQRGLALGVTRAGQRGIGVEQPADRGLVAPPDGVEELARAVGARGSRLRVEVGAQGPPARKAAASRDDALGVAQPGSRIGAAKIPERVLGELLQEFEIGAIRQGRDAPSFHVPGVRGIGRKVAMSMSSDRWVRPFTRTVSRLDG